MSALRFAAALILCTLSCPIALRADPPHPLEKYRGDVERIVDAARASDAGWRKLSQLCDGIGHRLSGSTRLEQAVEWAVKTLKADGQENVRAEPVQVPKWVRGRESLEMLEPRQEPLAMLGLGGSVGTPPEGITAEVVAVTSQEQLRELGEKVRGKIVLFDVPMPTQRAESGAGYGTAVRYRTTGARWAAEFGAVASLTRSVTTHSMRTPHTGAMNYGDASPRIPAACVSIEDAMTLSRMLASGMTVKLCLKMEARSAEPANSANVVAELRGREKPDEIVLIGGHLDSWDVGQGAHDDGGGCVQAMEALNLLRKLNLRPKRTIRCVLFTNEENGLAGGKAYAKDHADEVTKHFAAIESDSGSFRPLGYSFDAGGEVRSQPGQERIRSDAPASPSSQRQAAAQAQLDALLALFPPAYKLTAEPGGGGADISPLRNLGVPVLGHRVDMTRYFDYHHTQADTLDKVDPRELQDNIAVLAAVAYILADMPEKLGDSD